jgi:endonuclease-3
LDDLLKLPGVGRKTANIVLFVSFGIPSLAVDTHVHRISNRLGWVKTKNPEETEFKLMELIPKELWGPLNGSMVEFGKQICKPVKPECKNCPIEKYCNWEGKNDSII